MKKRLIPALLLIAALLLTVIAPAETTETPVCPGCGTEENHTYCELCDAYDCDPAAAPICEACGLCPRDPAYMRVSHKVCSGCGMHKCDPAYEAAAHSKCNGCHALLCAGEEDHSFCPRCNRYACKESDQYDKHDHRVNWWGRPLCLDIVREPSPVVKPEANCPGGCGAPVPCSLCPWGEQGYSDTCGKYLCQADKCGMKKLDGSICNEHHNCNPSARQSHNPCCLLCPYESHVVCVNN